jgi:hypothetical protein
VFEHATLVYVKKFIYHFFNNTIFVNLKILKHYEICKPYQKNYKRERTPSLTITSDISRNDISAYAQSSTDLFILQSVLS